jgi:hypothetical protein
MKQVCFCSAPSAKSLLGFGRADFGFGRADV